ARWRPRRCWSSSHWMTGCVEKGVWNLAWRINPQFSQALKVPDTFFNTAAVGAGQVVVGVARARAVEVDAGVGEAAVGPAAGLVQAVTVHGGSIGAKRLAGEEGSVAVAGVREG